MWQEDKIELCTKGEVEHDGNFDPVKSSEKWIELGNCKIHGNKSSKTIRASDGSDYVYSYQITMYTPSVFPALSDKVRITKADRSISRKVMTVVGSGTTKGKLSIFL